MLRGKTIVGHSLHHDFSALEFECEQKLQRDISLYGEYKVEGKKARLQQLARDFLGVVIQSGQHSSVEDARAGMALYVLKRSAIDSALKFLASQR